MDKKCSQEDFHLLSQVVAILQDKLAQQELNEASFSSTSFSLAPKSLIQIDTKIKLVPFDGSIDAEKVDAWIRDLEVYFESQGFADDQQCLFAKLKLTKHALLWWDSLCSRRAKAGLDPISVWADMKEQILASCPDSTSPFSDTREEEGILSQAQSSSSLSDAVSEPSLRVLVHVLWKPLERRDATQSKIRNARDVRNDSKKV
eukprot:Gb_27215 [translate_table: standard]